MAIHVCRDFLSNGNPLSSQYVPYSCLYYLAIFARVCLNYSVVGQTAFNIDGTTLRLGHGSAGSINHGTGNEYAFSADGYTVSASDIGRILVIRSPGYPMVNSGLFRVTGVDLTNNWLFVNYRSGDVPPVETGMTWGLYENENSFIGSLNIDPAGDGTTGGYAGKGSAGQTRIILQSPSTINWQVRLSTENQYDRTVAFVDPNTTNGPVSQICTIAPGYNGDTKGDFQPGGQHLHAGLFFNKHDPNLK